MRFSSPILFGRWPISLLLLTALSAAAFAAEDPEVLIRQGVALRKAGENAKAQGYFQRAYDIAKTPRSAAQLGLVEFALQLWVPSETHLAEALGALSDSWIHSNQVTLQESLTEVRSHLGRVRISGEPSGARVRIAGAERGELPIPVPLYVAPGSAIVDVDAAGHQSFHQTLTLAAGQEERLEIRLVPLDLSLPKGQAANLPPDRGPQDGHPDWRRTAAWITAGGAAAFLAAGGLALHASNNNYDAFNDELIPGTTQHRCSKATVDTNGGSCKDHLSAGDRDKVLAVVGFVGGAALAATSAFLFVASRSTQESQPAAVACAPGSVSILGATCMVRF